MTIPTMGVHHITLIGSNRQDTIDFYSGVLGMPFVFEQPNLDVPEESHLYFAVHHIAYAVSRETFDRAVKGLEELGFPNSGRVDRGFMDSLYFRDPNGHLIELAVYVFEPPDGVSRREVFEVAHKIRVEKGDYNIAQEHLDAAIAQLKKTPVSQPAAF
jgi:catechol 2,3-dioxygenase-like lactoylglutathione lyase family enzyme